MEKRPTWLAMANVMELIGGVEGGRQAAYRRYVEEAVREGVEEQPWERVQAGLLLGTKGFVERVARRAKGDRHEQTSLRQLVRRVSLADVIGAVERVRRETWSAFVDRHGDWGRDMVLYLGRKHTGMTLRALGERVGGMDYVAVAAAVRRMGGRMGREKALRRTAVEIEAQLYNV